jgi:hypothetical protein
MQLPTQYRVLHYLASRPHVRQICETGFNFGHSSFNFLTANTRTMVQSFDIGHHQYTGFMINYLTSLFPKRLSVELGDSKETVSIVKFALTRAPAGLLNYIPSYKPYCELRP